MVSMAARPLTRGEIAELADRLRGLITMIEADEMSATTAMTYRVQGAVTALEALQGDEAIRANSTATVRSRRCRQVPRGLGGGDVTQTGAPSKATS
jgi:hypothetical protein